MPHEADAEKAHRSESRLPLTAEPQILLVDDDAVQRYALKAILEPLGLPVIEADSGVAALRCVIRQDFAVILLDVCMPSMDGFETAAFIRQRQQSEMTPIIFITAFGGDEVRNMDHYSEGAVDFIVAPVDPEELRAKVTVFANLFAKAAVLATHAQEVQTSADQLRMLTDVAPIGIFQTDAAGRYVYTNPRWSQIMGIAAEEASGRHWDLPIGPEDVSPTATELLGEDEPEHELWRYFEIPCAGSAPRVVLLAAASIPDAQGGRVGWVGTVADVTAEARAEAAAALLGAVVESSHDAIVSKDLNGVITSWNAGAQLLYGYEPAEAVGRHMSMIVPPGQDPEVPEVPTGANSTKPDESYETIRVRKDGTTVDVSLTTSPIVGPGGTLVGASVIARDISHRRKAEQLKDEFLALVSHELRTPLSSIVAHIEILLDDDDIKLTRRRQFLEVVDRNAARLERLVGDLLFVAQLESTNLSLAMSDVDIVAVAEEAVEAATPLARQSSVEVRLVAPVDSYTLTGDPGRLGQAIDNLISNAIKYSPEGGEVAVRINPDNDECVIEVEDHGMGIAPDEQEHVFDRFFRASTAVDLHIQGVGLGLSIAKKIVTAHGGRVGVRSEPGVGTTFCIGLPPHRSSDQRRPLVAATLTRGTP